MTRADRVVLAGMSAITSVAMGTWATTFQDAETAGVIESPLESREPAIGYFCAGAPLFDSHFMEGV